MKLTVILPTFRRPLRLEKTLASIAAARVPEWLEVEICVVDNNSQDETAAVSERWRGRLAPRMQLTYVLEVKPGSSEARNAGIRATTSHLVGFIDDDEEIAPQWFEVAAKAFQEDPGLAFIGGPYLPRWEHDPPSWLPVHDYPAVIGWVEAGPHPLDYGPTYPGVLMGGNAVIRREWFDRLGLYSTHLGRFGNRPTCGEDAEFYGRLIDVGARGRYLPDLAIYHWIPAQRLTKKYFREWTYWHGYSTVASEASYSGPKWFGLCRWRYGRALRSLLPRLRAALRPGELRPEEFSCELTLVALAGMLMGRWALRR